MKKTVCCILLCSFLLIAFNSYNSISTYAEVESDSVIIDDIAYYLSDDGSYYILDKSHDETSDIIKIPATIEGKPVKKIDSYAFSSCGASQIILPDTIVYIAGSVFIECYNLTKVVIPDSVEIIDQGNFSACDVLQLNEYDNGLYYGTTSNPYFLMVRPKSRDITSCIIHEDTVMMPDGFYRCPQITSINIPASVKYIDSRITAGCDSLTSITISPNNEVYFAENNCIIEKSTKTLIAGCPASVIPNNGSVVAIGEYAFWRCNGLTEIVIPAPVKSVGAYAFRDSENLERVYIAESVVTTGRSIFEYCSSLTDVYYQVDDRPEGYNHYAATGWSYNEHWGYESDIFNSSVSLGDINGNIEIDMTDYILLKRAYFGTFDFNEAQKIAGDINKNNKIDMTDYILLKRAYFGTYVIE